MLRMVRIIVGSKRKFFYAGCYGMVSTVPCRIVFFVGTGWKGLENQILGILGGGCEVSPYVKGREGVACRQGGHHGGWLTGVLPT